MIKRINKLIISGLSILILSFSFQCNAINTPNWWFWAMFGVPWIGVVGTDKNQEDSLIHTIRKAINWVLGLLSFICLCLVIYAGFLMLTSGWDSKKYEKWFWIIKNAWIWLAIIGVSWLIVSLIFYVINGAIETKQ